MNLEGKVWGYNKKTVVIVVYTLIIIGVAFFAGAKYEKRKLNNLGNLKSGSGSSVSTKHTGAKKTKAANPADNATQNNAATQDNSNTPASDSSQQNATQPANTNSQNTTSNAGN